jgi:pyruvate, water dikinase
LGCGSRTVSAHRAFPSLDVVRLAQLQANRPESPAQVGELAAQLGTLSAQQVAIVDGLVLPTARFIAHCQAAGIPATQSSDQDCQSFAQQCQAAMQQTSCADWLPQLQATWERSVLGHPLVVLRPSLALPLPIAASDLLTPRIGAIDELEGMLKALWAEVFCARNLGYWPQYCEDLGQIPLATLIQPLRTIEQSGRLWVTETTLILERFWGVQWLGHPQEIDVPITVIDWATGQSRSSPANPQQLVHSILGHWPRALPLVTPLIVAGDQWLLPHALPQADRASVASPLPASPVTAAMVIELAQALWTEFPQPLRVDWQYSQNQLQVQTIYLGETPPLAALLAQVAAVPAADRTDDDRAAVVPLAIGLATSGASGVGRAVVIQPDQPVLKDLAADSILVMTHLTPEWLPLMRYAAGMIMEQGGLTSHAAVIARSLGIPAIVGVAQATQKIQTGDWLKFEAGAIQRLSADAAIAIMTAAPTAKMMMATTAHDNAPIVKKIATSTKTQLLVTISHPSQISAPKFRLRDGIGLVRGEHLLAPDLAGCSPWQPLRDSQCVRLTQALVGSLQTICGAADYPVWYRFADWRSREMPAGMIVPIEGNPALGMHGTWYYQNFPEWLELELAAIGQLDGRARSRLRLVLPFVRTPDEVRYCVAALAAAGLADVPLWMMAEVPAILYALPECAAAGIRGIAIGLNDLLQLLFGVDRDQALMADFFDPSHPAIKSVLRSVLSQLITTAQGLGLACTVCSVPADAALIEFLVDCGVTGIVVNAGDLDFAEAAMLPVEGADS